MIRTAVWAWISGVSVVLATAAIAPRPAATPAGTRDAEFTATSEGNVSPQAAEVPMASAPQPIANVRGRRSATVPVPSVSSDSDVAPHITEPVVVGPAPEVVPPAMLDNPLIPVVPPAAATPAAVQFDGVPASLIVGDRVNLNLATLGTIKSYAWTVMPPGTVGLKVYDGGTKADFTSRFPGTYVFLVAVAGADGSVAQAYHALELRADCVPASLAPPAISSGTPATADAPPPSADPDDLIRRWTAEVHSPRRRAEQRQIASAFRQAAGMIDSGMLGGDDLLAHTKALCTLALGGDLRAWEPWFAHVEQLYREFERLKLLGTPANLSAAHKNVARALESTADP